MSIRRSVLTLLVSVCALAGLLLSWGAVAQGEVTHHYLSQFNEVPGNLGGPLMLSSSSMTVDSSHLWVAEPTRVDEFDAATGSFLAQLTHAEGSTYGEYGIAVGHAGGEARVYVGEVIEGEPAVAVFDEAGTLKATWKGTGTPAGSFGSLVSDVAVDNSTNPLDKDKGDIYVAAPLQQAIDVFRPEADGKEHYVGQITGTSPSEPFAFPFKLDVGGANGELVVNEAGAGIADIFEPAALGEYTFTGSITATPSGPLRSTFNLAVDGGSGEIYLTEGFGEIVVDQFSSTGSYQGRFDGADSPGGGLRNVYSLAVDPESHDVYIGNVRGEPEHPSAVDIFGPDLVLPDVTTGSVVNSTPRSATLAGTVNPDEAGPATCRFAWGTSTAFGHTAPCSPPEIANGNTPVSVQGTLSEATHNALEPDTTYYYRLQAANKNGTNTGEDFQDQHFTTSGPGLHGQSVADVTASSATLQATINPHEVATTSYFQYGTTTDYGADAPVLEGASAHGAAVGEDEGDVEVAQHLQGLQASTVYHYRVIAVSEPTPGKYEEFAGPDETFTTQTIAGEEVPADNRMWEMVSPPEKYGANLEPISEQGGLEQAATGGNGFTYASSTPVEAEAKGFAGKVQEFSTRGPNGWAPVTITVPHAGVTSQPIGYGPEYRAFSSDLSQAAIQPLGVFNPGLSAEASEQTAFLRSTYVNGNVAEPCTSSCYRPLATGAAGYANVPAGTVFGGGPSGSGSGCGLVGCGPNFVGATPDMSHVVFKSSAGLTPGPGSDGGLFEWSAGQLAFVGTGAVGKPSAEADRHSISDDGSRVVIDGEAEGVAGLLMRDMLTGETIKLDAVQGGSGEGSAEPDFQAAASDGSRVFFTDAQRLTADASIAAGRDLYECDMVREAGKLKCQLSDLTPPVSGEGAAVQGGVLGVSEDGSWVYFVADGSLGTSAPRGTCGVSPPGTCNLFVLHFDGTSWEEPKFITTLSEEDSNDWSEDISGQPTRVSPDGRWLTLMAQESLTGYDNRDAVNGRLDAEVYLYDAGTGRLSCASCDPTGARPVGREYFELEPGSGGLVGGPRGIWGSSEWVAANVPGWQHTNISEAVQDYQSRYLSNGGRLFFNTDDALVPQDVNGTQDVYEFEPPEVGTRTMASVTFSERSGGCVGLVSSGTSPTESGFLDASEGGGDVFFISDERLVPQDFDTSLDIYDAHECTVQVPCRPVVGSPPPCSTGDACKPAPTPQPAIYGSPSSATFSGVGNVAPSTAGGVAPKSLSRAQKLARALKACRVKRVKARAVCERRARKRYAVRASRKASKTNRKRG